MLWKDGYHRNTHVGMLSLTIFFIFTDELMED